ncbi:MAG: hypothetical protein ACI8UO_003936 [Verrucomicrobiales bacterium]
MKFTVFQFCFIMQKTPILTALAGLAVLGSGLTADYPLKPVSYNDVEMTSDFWRPRMITQRETLVPWAFERTEPGVAHLQAAADFLEGKKVEDHRAHRFIDSDLYKVMEGAAYLLQLERNPELEAQMDRIIAVIGAAQEPNGYLYPSHTTKVGTEKSMMGDKPYSFVVHSHELYNMGHLYEAAVAYYETTGKDALLKIAKKNAQHINKVFFEGDPNYNDGKPIRQAPGHQEPELALVKLYRVTGNELYLDMARKFLEIRGVTYVPDDEKGNYFMHTSYEQRATIRHPGLGAWHQKMRGKLNPTMPASVFVGRESRFHGSGGFFEPEFEPLAISEPRSGLKYAHRSIDEARFERRMSLANDLDAEFLTRYNSKPIRAYGHMYADAVRLMESPDLAAFDIHKEDAQTQQRYGSEPFGQGCLLARRLIERDVRTVEVSFGSWDTHQNNFTSLPELCHTMDRAVSALLDDLQRIGKLEETVVVLTTEFGRTPIVNQNIGRDHYPKAFTRVLAGGGFKGGYVHGKTSEGAEEVIENPLTIPHFNATIAYALGIPIDHILYSPSKRPFTVAHKGTPELALFA